MQRRKAPLWQALHTVITAVIQNAPSKAKHPKAKKFATQLADDLEELLGLNAIIDQHWKQNVHDHGLHARIELAKVQIHALARTLDRMSDLQRRLLPGEIEIPLEVRSLAEAGALPEPVEEHLLWPPHWSDGVLASAAVLRDYQAVLKRHRGRPSRSKQPHWIVRKAYTEWRRCFNERPGCSERSPFPNLVAGIFDVAAPDETSPSYSTIAKMIGRLEVEKLSETVE